MNRNYDNTGSYLLSGFNSIMVAIQDNELFQTIQFILTLISTLLVIVFTAYKFYHRVMEDGKITNDEIEEAIELGIESVEKIEDVIKKGDKEDDKKA